MTDVPPGERFGGSPAQPIRDQMRAIAMLNKLAVRKTSGASETEN
jgi:UDP-3-O-[3-hydroxymyristoyl] glucosamine N-acyltransferase